MAFNGSEGGPIDSTTAAKWTRKYREANPGAVQSRFFGKEILHTILNQPGCEGIRFYYGLNGSSPELVAVGANSEENDQIGVVSGVHCIVADESHKAPPHSSQPNSLNTTPQQHEDK